MPPRSALKQDKGHSLLILKNQIALLILILFLLTPLTFASTEYVDSRGSYSATIPHDWTAIPFSSGITLTSFRANFVDPSRKYILGLSCNTNSIPETHENISQSWLDANYNNTTFQLSEMATIKQNIVNNSPPDTIIATIAPTTVQLGIHTVPALEYMSSIPYNTKTGRLHTYNIVSFYHRPNDIFSIACACAGDIPAEARFCFEHYSKQITEFFSSIKITP